jgi:hypothetical protein
MTFTGDKSPVKGSLYFACTTRDVLRCDYLLHVLAVISDYSLFKEHASKQQSPSDDRKPSRFGETPATV